MTDPDTPPLPAGGRRRDADATRGDLLRAARRRFTMLGYERTTVRDVAKDVGVNLALINRYFGSKEGLFQAALLSSDLPPFLDGLSGTDDLAGRLAEQLDGERWPDAGGENPVLLWLRDSGDDRTRQLRRRALGRFSDAILSAAGRDHHDRPDDDSARRLRAQLAVAVMIGAAVMRATLEVEPLATATSDDLAPPLRDVLRALLG